MNFEKSTCCCGELSTIGTVHRTDGPCFIYEATSKADTGEVRNAALEEAAAVCVKRANNWLSFDGELDMEQRGCAGAILANSIRALKSATPSTIKEEPTGEFNLALDGKQGSYAGCDACTCPKGFCQSDFKVPQ